MVSLKLFEKCLTASDIQDQHGAKYGIENKEEHASFGQKSCERNRQVNQPSSRRQPKKDSSNIGRSCRWLRPSSLQPGNAE